MDDEPTELEKAWEHAIAKEEARAFADELLQVVTTALEDAQVEVGRRLWTRACDEDLERVGNAPLVDAIADVEPRLSRATQYRAIGVYLQSLHLPEEAKGLLGPSKLYALLRLPNDHIEKKALARRAALSNMPLRELVHEIDDILGVEREDRGQSLGVGVFQLSRSVKALRARARKFVPKDQRDLDRHKARMRGVLAAVQALVDDLDTVVVPRKK